MLYNISQYGHNFNFVLFTSNKGQSFYSLVIFGLIGAAFCLHSV